MRKNQISKSNWGKVVKSGMGGFLCPPSYPNHKYSVQSVYGDTFSMSLDAALEAEWLDEECKHQIRMKLKSWKVSAMESPKILKWCCYVLGYFKDSYKKDPKDRNVNSSNSITVKHTAKGQIKNQDKHLGVLTIRDYYPDFKLTKFFLDNAFYGWYYPLNLNHIDENNEAIAKDLFEKYKGA